MDPVERVCPLCNAPRTANRCTCGYTFEFERPRRGGGEVRGRKPPFEILAVAVLGAVIAGLLVMGSPGLAAHRELGWLLVPAGLFSVAGAWFGWRWFFAMGKARTMRSLLGATGARLFYALLGGVLVGIGGVLLAA